MAKAPPKPKAPALAIVAIVVLLIVLAMRKGKSAPRGASSDSAYAPGASSPGPFAPSYGSTSPVDTGQVYGPPSPGTGSAFANDAANWDTGAGIV